MVNAKLRRPAPHRRVDGAFVLGGTGGNSIRGVQPPLFIGQHGAQLANEDTTCSSDDHPSVSHHLRHLLRYGGVHHKQRQVLQVRVDGDQMITQLSQCPESMSTVFLHNCCCYAPFGWLVGWSIPVPCDGLDALRLSFYLAGMHFRVLAWL